MSAGEWTRRGFLASLAAAAFAAPGRAPSFPSESRRYSDPSTDLPVVRLTSPAHSSSLPAACHRAVSRKGTFLIFSSDRTGSPQLMRMSLGTGESRQLTEAAHLDPHSPTLAPDDHSVFFFDGPALRQLILSSGREREAYRVPEGWRRGRGFNLRHDASKAFLSEEDGRRWRLREAPLDPKKEGQPATVIEAATPLLDPLPRPRHEDVLYRDAEDTLILASEAGGPGRRLPLAPGRCGGAFWTADGDSLLYLSLPSGPGQLAAIREWVAGEDRERLVASTSQFASFAPNANASVFVGASASKAAPYILLLLRVARRELPLCEHRSSDAATVAPFFSPDSQRVFFQSDRDGKPAIYAVDVQRLVERT